MTPSTKNENNNKKNQFNLNSIFGFRWNWYTWNFLLTFKPSFWHQNWGKYSFRTVVTYKGIWYSHAYLFALNVHFGKRIRSVHSSTYCTGRTDEPSCTLEYVFSNYHLNKFENVDTFWTIGFVANFLSIHGWHQDKLFTYEFIILTLRTSNS